MMTDRKEDTDELLPDADERELVRERVEMAMNVSDPYPTSDERDRIAEVMQGAPLWHELPQDVRELIVGWETQAGIGHDQPSA